MTDPEQTKWLTSPVVWAAGLAGAMVSLGHVQTLNIRQRAATLLTGTVAAGFVTPAVAEWWGLTTAYVALVGFVLGIAGMSLTAAVVNLGTKLKSDPETFLRWAAGLAGRQLAPLPPSPPPTPPEAKPIDAPKSEGT